MKHCGKTSNAYPGGPVSSPRTAAGAQPQVAYAEPVLTISTFRECLNGREPRVLPVEGKRLAAVAIVLRVRGGRPEVLFIERAQKEGDPWSGHMAFPGGRVEPGDSDSRRAAERETLEEVGVDLAGAEWLGRIDDMEGHHAADSRMLVSAFVFHLADAGEPSPNHEVREAFWFPVESLLEPERHVVYSMERLGTWRYPAIVVGHPQRHRVWGLTYKFLEVLLEAVGSALPDRWQETPEIARPPRRSR
ncbi:CoA pyrophosphatase [Myxococcota bacterium]|nr:CoA pyrophosphatase [Myxococcota bacterium]